MERRIVTRHRTADKSVSTSDTQVNIEGITSSSSTSKDDSPEDGKSKSTCGERVVDGLSGNEVNNDFRVGRTFVGSGGDDAPTGHIDERINGECVANVSVNDRKTRKEQLKSLVDLITEML